MKVDVEDRSGVHVVRLTGETLGEEDSALVETVTTLLEDRGARIVIDLSAVKFINSTGLGSLVWGYPFLTTHTAHLTLPLVGEVHLASALFFDAGVFATVVGATLLTLTALAHQSVRSHRQAPERSAAAGTGPREAG